MSIPRSAWVRDCAVRSLSHACALDAGTGFPSPLRRGKGLSYDTLIGGPAPKKDVEMADEEKKGKAEETAEKTGQLVGKGLKKGWGVVKGVGKGAKDAVTEKKEEEKK